MIANYPPHCKNHFWNMQRVPFDLFFFWIAQNHFLTKPFDRNWSHDSRKVWHFGIRNIFEIIFLKFFFQKYFFKKYLQQFFQYPSVIPFIPLWSYWHLCNANSVYGAISSCKIDIISPPINKFAHWYCYKPSCNCPPP